MDRLVIDFVVNFVDFGDLASIWVMNLDDFCDLAWIWVVNLGDFCDLASIWVVNWVDFRDLGWIWMVNLAHVYAQVAQMYANLGPCVRETCPSVRQFGSNSVQVDVMLAQIGPKFA